MKMTNQLLTVVLQLSDNSPGSIGERERVNPAGVNEAGGKIRHTKTNHKKAMKKLSSICKAMTLALLLPVSAANAGGLECAIQTALEGPRGAKVQLFNHSFEVQPPEVVSKQKRQYALAGKLIHHNAGLNEAIAYRVIKENGAIKEISLQVGFEDVNYFSRLFRRKTHSSPRTYRARSHRRFRDRLATNE